MVSRHSGGMDVVSSRHEKGRAGGPRGTQLPYRVTKITKTRAMAHSQLVEISPQLAEPELEPEPEPEPVVDDVDRHERRADEDETHVF